MAPHPQPIIDSLNRQLNIFGCFQPDHNQTPTLGDAEQIDHTAIPRSQRGNLRIQVLGIQMGIKSGGILQDERLQPALWRRAIERMICLLRLWLAMPFKIPYQSRKFRRRRGRQVYSEISQTEGNTLSVPTRELQSSETNRYFRRTGCDASFDYGRSARCQCSNARNAFF